MSRTNRIYHVIYLVGGERHRHLRDFESYVQAYTLTCELRAEGYQAWVEEVS